MQQLGLSDKQLNQITTIAVALPVEKRGILLRRLVAYCQVRGLYRPSDDDIDAALCSALTGLKHEHHEHAEHLSAPTGSGAA